MNTTEQTQSQDAALSAKPLTMFFDGSGCRPDGEGSGFAWLRPDTGQRHVERVKGLTNNQAEYRAFLAALQNVPEGSTVEMFSDLQLLCSQFEGNYRVKDYALQELLSEVRALILNKQLKVKLQWVPRSRNLAGKLL
ncbi:MAG: RNase H family protein [Candidatus Sulfotelmatobacter sp.]|jgi:ribonuclease HI